MDRLVVVDGIPHAADATVRVNNGTDENKNVITLTFTGQTKHFSYRDTITALEIIEDDWRLQYRDARVIHTSIDISDDEPVEQTVELSASKYEYI